MRSSGDETQVEINAQAGEPGGPRVVKQLRFKVRGEEEVAAVIGGIMEVSTSEVTIMSDVAELDVEIDEARAKQAKERVEAEKTQRTDKIDVYASELALSRAMARLKAAELGKLRKQRGGGIR